VFSAALIIVVLKCSCLAIWVCTFLLLCYYSCVNLTSIIHGSAFHLSSFLDFNAALLLSLGPSSVSLSSLPPQDYDLSRCWHLDQPLRYTRYSSTYTWLIYNIRLLSTTTITAFCVSRLYPHVLTSSVLSK